MRFGHPCATKKKAKGKRVRATCKASTGPESQRKAEHGGARRGMSFRNARNNARVAGTLRGDGLRSFILAHAAILGTCDWGGVNV